jgi:restriction system protein
MKAWLIRAGRKGERENFVLENACAGTGFAEVPDLTDATTRELIAAAVEAGMPDKSPKAVMNYAAQLNALRNRVAVGDLAVLPLKSAQIAVGKITSLYKYDATVDPELRHTVGVNWLKTDIPRPAVMQDLLYSLGAFSTICEVRRNDAVYRLEQLALTGADPGARASWADTGPIEVADAQVVDTTSTEIDIAEQSRTQVMIRVREKFAGHDMEDLVAAVLTANGFSCRVVPEGPDGGIDIYAGKGPLGLDAPRLIVQVKSSPTPVDAPKVRELQGVLSSLGADQGLLVAWGGLTKPAQREVSTMAFRVRVWDSNDLLNAIFDVYDDLPEEIRAELPLRRVWTLVDEED